MNDNTTENIDRDCETCDFQIRESKIVRMAMDLCLVLRDQVLQVKKEKVLLVERIGGLERKAKHYSK